MAMREYIRFKIADTERVITTEPAMPSGWLVQVRVLGLDIPEMERITNTSKEARELMIDMARAIFDATVSHPARAHPGMPRKIVNLTDIDIPDIVAHSTAPLPDLPKLS